jgi:hypothetical protein
MPYGPVVICGVCLGSRPVTACTGTPEGGLVTAGSRVMEKQVGGLIAEPVYTINH